jgi:hypothetical protein
LGLAGAALLGIGVFMPVYRDPMMGGTINYIGSGKGPGLVVLFCAVGAFFAVWHRQRAKGLVAGLIAGLMLVLSIVAFIAQREAFKAQMAQQFAPVPGLGNVFTALTNAVVDSFQYEWGWLLLAAGCVLLVFSGLHRERASDDEEELA